MKRIKVCFRLSEDLYRRLNEESDNLSELLRQMVITGLFKMAFPRQEELDELIKTNDALRKVAVNFNQSVRALNVAIVQNETVKTDLMNDLKQAAKEIHVLRNVLARLIGKYYES